MPRSRALGNVRDTLRKKRVVPQVGVRIERDRREEDDDGLLKQISDRCGNIECGIVEGTLGTLHPINDASALGIGCAPATQGDTGIEGEGFEFRHGRSFD